MNLYFKFFALILKRVLFRKKQTFTETCESHFLVTPADLDLNFHMNNGRFFSVMDLGRFDMMMRTGFFGSLFMNGYYPVILSESMVFKKSLTLWQKYQLFTQLHSWDKNFFYISQKFYRKDSLIASANVRACFKKRGRKGIVPVSEIFNFVGETHPPTTMTSLSEKQIEIDDVLSPR